MALDLKNLVDRPVPPNAAARDVILAALADGKPRPVAEGETRLIAAVPGLLADGIVVPDPQGLRLAPGARDAASAAAGRVRASREARADWGREFQAALRARRRHA